MPLRFPPVEDIPLANAPLTEVICQVRFPTILSIGRGQPIKFQEAIRQRFPELEEERRVQMRLVSGPDAEIPNVETGGRTFRFQTAQGEVQVTLSVDAFAVSTSRYRVWSDFAGDLALVHEAAMAAYELPYAKRIGLRYVNQFDGARIGCASFEEMKGFLRPELAALMATDAWDSPEELVSQILLRDDGGRLLLRVAARAATDQPPVVLLDFDYYEEGRSIPLNDLVERCTRFHDVIYRAFRWSIRPDQLDVFAPVEREA